MYTKIACNFKLSLLNKFSYRFLAVGIVEIKNKIPFISIIFLSYMWLIICNIEVKSC